MPVSLRIFQPPKHETMKPKFHNCFNTRSSSLALAAFWLIGLSSTQATLYTWTKNSAATQTWTTAGNWSGSTAFVTGNTNGLVFFSDTTTALANGTNAITTSVPTTLTMNVLTLNGKGAAATAATAINIASSSSTWTLDGTTPQVNLNGVNGSQALNYTVAAKLALNQTNTLFTGDGTASVKFSGIISGASNSITKSGVSALTLSGANTFSGGVTLKAGTIRIDTDNAALGTGTFQIGDSTGTSAVTVDSLSARTITNTLSIYQDFTCTGTNTLTQGTGAITLATNGTTGTHQITVSASTLTLGGIIGDGGGGYGITKAGSGTLTLSGANTFTGQLTVQQGALSIATINNISAAGVLGNSASPVILGNTGGMTGTLSYTGATASSTKKFTLATGGTGAFDVSTAANTLTVSGVIDGSGNLSKAGAGTLALSGANTYTGATTISGGTLKISNAGTFTNTSGISLSSGGRLEVAVSNQSLAKLAGPTGSGVAAGTILRYSTAQTTAGAANGPGTILGTVELSLTNVNPNYTLDFGAGSTLTNLVTATYTKGITLSGDTSIASSSAVFTGTGMTISASSAGTKSLTLTGSHTGANVITGNITDGSGVIAVAKTGVGTWRLSGVNTYTGGTTVSGGGILIFSAATAIGGSGQNVSVAAGSDVALDGTADPSGLISRLVTSSAGTIALNSASSTAIDLSTLTAASLGASGAYTYSGTLTPNGTTYRLGGGAGTLTVSAATFAAGNNLIVTNGAGSSGMTIGTGGVILTDDNTAFNGTVTIDANNALQLGTGGTAGWFGTPSSITNNGVLYVNRSDTRSVGLIGGAGSLIVAGGTTLTLTANNTMSGGLCLDGATAIYSVNQATTLTGGITFGATTASTNASSLDLTSANMTASALTIQSNNASANTVTIGTGKTLAINGAVLIGSGVATANTAYDFTGDGSFTVLNPTGSMTISDASTSSGKTAVVDMTDLGACSVSVDQFTVGAALVGAGSRAGGGDLKLAKNSTITAVDIHVGDSTSSYNIDQTSYLRLSRNGTGGDVNNTIKATTITVGGFKANGQMLYATATGTGNTSITGATGGTSRVTTFTVGDRGYNSTITGVADFSNGGVTAYVDTLNIGVKSAGTTLVSANGTFTMGTDSNSLVDINTINAAMRIGSAVIVPGEANNATFNIGGGTFRFGTFNVGADAGVTQSVTFNLKGGTLASNTTAATAMSPGAFTIGTGTSGSAVTFGQISGGTGALTITSAFTLTDNTTATVNVGTILTGTIASSTTNLTKQGSGTLTLSGTASNVNTGLVTVTQGELDLNKADGVNAIGGNLTISGGTAKLLLANQLADDATVTVSSGSFNTNNLTETVGTFNLSGGTLDGTTGTLTAGTCGLTGGTVNAKLGAGTINVSAGMVTLGSAGRLNSASTLSVQGGGLTLAGAENVASYQQTGGTLAGGGNTLTSAAAYDMQAGTVSANLGGGGALNKTTTGTLTLSGTNTYTGATTVNAGTLALVAAGSIASTSVSIAAGATLDTTAQASYTSPTSLAFGVESSGTSGQINATGKTLDISGSAVTFNVSGTLTAPAYVLATYGTKSGSNFSSVSGLPTGYTIDYAYSGGTQIALVKSGSAGFSSWIDTNFPALSDKSAGGDPDNDGISNLLEYVLNGNPGAADTSILPALSVTPTSFVFTFHRLDESEADTTLTFQYGATLGTWENVTIGAVDSGPDGNGVTVGVVENGTAPDGITVTVPRGSNTKLFGRLRVTQP